MKKAMIVVSVLCVLMLGSCFSPWGNSGEGRLVIALGSTGSSARTLPDFDEGRTFDHEVILTAPGRTPVVRWFSGTSGTITVPVGEWHISIRAWGPIHEDYASANAQLGITDQFPARMLRAVWEIHNDGYPFPIQPGQETVLEEDFLNLHPAANVSTHAQLLVAIDLAEPFEEKFILIERGFEAEGTYTIDDNRRIFLFADSPITITRKLAHGDEIFYVGAIGIPSTLTLGINEGMGGMRGSITINGAISGNAQNALVVVTDGTFEMHDGVTLTRNEVDGPSFNFDVGGVLVLPDGTFEMHGGIISDNTGEGWAGTGGVIVVGGTFNMSGGTIFRNKGEVAGGVSVRGGTFNMFGGTISGNKGREVGGVRVPTGGSYFYMHGGTISRNKGEEVGGVNVINGLPLRMSNGVIYGSDVPLLANVATDLLSGVAAVNYEIIQLVDSLGFALGNPRTVNGNDTIRVADGERQ
ncbi:MAG: hypothetical protein FWC97_06640 [Treponema sp.]|nr:hypothetical protein [Treponema sp.]